VPAGQEAVANADVEEFWGHGVGAVADRHQRCLTAAAAVQDMLRAVAAALVDAKLRTQTMTTGQTLVSIETSMHVLLHGTPGTQKDGKPVGGGLLEGGSSQVLVDSCLLPSWPPLQAASAGTTLVSLLVAMEQRLLLAHTGANCQTYFCSCTGFLTENDTL
jgi:hypothetical protein